MLIKILMISLISSQLLANEIKNLKTPDWAKSAIWYQIFPERFRNGDFNNFYS